MGVFNGYQPNIFRAVSGSLFSTVANWSRGYLPTGSDVADIADNCVIDVSRTIGSLIVRAPFTASINTGLTLQVNDAINVLGHLSCSGNPTINIVSRKNNINTLSPASSSFYYSGSNQGVLGLSYYNLTIGNNGTKTIVNNTTVLNNLTVQPTNNTSPASILELSRYDLIVSGTTSINGINSNTQTAAINKSGAGNVLFINALNFGFRAASAFDFSIGNPNVELRNGINFSQNLVGFLGYNFKSGVGIWSFTTNNQTIGDVASGQNTITFDSPMLIGSGVSLRIGTNTTNYSNLQISKYINGVSSSSAIVNVGNIVFVSKEAAETSMSTGSFDFTSSINTVTYGSIASNYSATIPTRFNTFRNLSISGAGIKTLGTSSYVSGAFTINAGTFNNVSSSITISGSTLVNSYGTWINTGTGSIKFIGPVRFGTAFTDRGSMNFTGGNPNVEVQNGVYFNTSYGEYYQPGRGTWTFSTNNQNVFVNGGAQTIEFNNIIVSGAIALCTTASILGSTGPGVIQISGSLNGTEANSKFVVGLDSFLYLNTLTPPMITGSLDTSSYYHTLGYVYNGNQTVPYSAYKTVYITGNATKSLAQNTVINNDLHVDGFFPMYYSTKFDNKNYSLVVSGSTLVSHNATIINTGGGSLTFIGRLRFGTAFTDGGIIDFTVGNPNVELRNGLFFNRGYNTTFYPGTGSYAFSTNNQQLYSIGGNTVAFRNIVISGSIALTMSSSLDFGYSALVSINGGINGTEANSKLINGNNSSVYYNAPQIPMLTGSIDFSSSLSNTFIYNSGSQNVKGGVYRNLTFLNGLKTLQGNVSVLGTFSTGSGATSGSFNLNGFTLTNP